MKIVGLLSVIFLQISYVFAEEGIHNYNVDRRIDLTTQLVKISYKIKIGNFDKNNFEYDFVLHVSESDHLAYISIKDELKKELKHTKRLHSSHTYFTILLSGNEFQTIFVEATFTKIILPYPLQIAQSENQLVRYFGNAYFLSPYKTLSQKTSVHLNTKNVESFTNVKPSFLVDATITYGTYKNIGPLSTEPIIIHYENFSPFLTVTRLRRTIEVSHWGNIAVEEAIDILHTGAELKGSFSRYDFQKDSRVGQSSVKSYKTLIPASAVGVYYRDTNGNISTSSMKILKDSIELDLRPRFPLFGGWKTHYTLGYNVPSFEYLFNNDQSFLLKMRVMDHIFDDMVVDELLVMIVLPEGSKNIKLITPYFVQRLPDTLHYTYLDTIGRPVINFAKQNLVEHHIHDFNLKYDFNRIMMLQEPLLVVIFLYIFFLCVVVWMRLDFSINHDKQASHKE